MRLHIDFETRSAIDLREVGAYIYAEHPTTDVWCAAYAFDDGPIKLWVPGQPCPDDVYCHILEGGILVAHNAAFERVIFQYIMGQRYGWPVPKLEQWRCTMAMAYAMALPGSLEEGALALGLPVNKDMSGRRLMLKMARPRKIEKSLILEKCEHCGGQGEVWDERYDMPEDCPVCKKEKQTSRYVETITWWNDNEHKKRLYTYCIQDVEAERQLEKRVMQLRTQEQKIWQLDQQINDLGVYIDKKLCDQALKVVADTKNMLDAEMNSITNGAVKACTEVSALVKWLQSQIFDPTAAPDEAPVVTSVNKESILTMLASWDITPTIRRALELRQEASKTSTAKIAKMLAMRASDGRMRGNLQYHGAGTGRWAARGAQLQNLPRPKIDDVPDAIETILKTGSAELISILYGSPLNVVSDCIRGMIAAPEGSEIMAADFSNIEGRGIAWLAGQEDKLDAFRAYDNKTGPDLYLVAASGIFGCGIESAKRFRQIGKVAELSLGYQGGPNAFAQMAGNYGLHIGDHFDVIWEAAGGDHRAKAEEGYVLRGKKSDMSRDAWLAAEVIKVAWRDSNPKIVNYWHALERAAIDAVKNPGQMFTVRNVSYKVSGSFLWCRLPSGRVLCYPYPKLKMTKTDWGEKEAVVYKCVDGMTRKWQDKSFYGGLAAENITQAVSRDIMAEAMLRVDAADYKPTITIHDEIVCEVPKDKGSLQEFIKLMTELPVWATGFPVSAEGWRGDRYRK